MSEIIKVQCLKHIYPDKTKVSVCGLDFIVKAGDRVVILGPNGMGKTTLIAHILGLLKPLEGEVTVFGKNPSKAFKDIRKKIGVVFQNVDEQIIGPTVRDDIAFTLRNEGEDSEIIDRRVNEIAKILNITKLLDKIPHYLSGGQKKKVALAGAISMLPALLILDEPFDGLDPKSKKEMITLINELNQTKGITTIITTHDINIVPHIADIIYILNEGHIVKSGTPEEIFSETEVLQRAHLEPPILVQLFERLQKQGVQVNIPVNVDEAQQMICNLVEASKKTDK